MWAIAKLQKGKYLHANQRQPDVWQREHLALETCIRDIKVLNNIHFINTRTLFCLPAGESPPAELELGPAPPRLLRGALAATTEEHKTKHCSKWSSDLMSESFLFHIYQPVSWSPFSLLIIGLILDRLKEKILKPWKSALSSHSVCQCAGYRSHLLT